MLELFKIRAVKQFHFLSNYLIDDCVYSFALFPRQTLKSLLDFRIQILAHEGQPPSDRTFLLQLLKNHIRASSR